MDMTFEYSGSKSGGNVTLKYPDGSCLLGGGTNGSDSSDPLVNGTSGSTGTSTCTPITGSTSGGSGREGCFTNESCPRYSGSSGSFSLPDVKDKVQKPLPDTAIWVIQVNTNQCSSLVSTNLLT